ncbi:MAG: lamin tail domain-containing protein [Planctomycetes bacterium]|nr:lamin tail domain-containing protein [Planctomycetota bacterium]
MVRGETAAPYSNDYIEIYNSGPGSQDLTGWSVQYASSAGSSWSVTNLPSVTLPGNRFLLIGEAAGSSWVAGQSAALPTPDASGSIAMAANDGKVALCNSTVA